MENKKVRVIMNPVPPMIHPLGSHWRQPDSASFNFFEVVEGGDKFVTIDEVSIKELHRYDCSIPSGVYEGKMWLRGGYLMWFEAHKTDAALCSSGTAKVI